MYDSTVNLLPLAGEPGLEAKFREEYYSSHESAAESESIIDPSITDPFFMARVWAKFARIPRV
jgi:hypothetical protein